MPSRSSRSAPADPHEIFRLRRLARRRDASARSAAPVRGDRPDPHGPEGQTRRAERLDAWRLTKSSRPALQEAAALFGGDVVEWKAAPTPGQYELFTATPMLPIIVPPGPEPVTQWYEQWNRGGATHRCDGATNFISDTPCSCNPEKRECKITTRVNVMLPDLPGLGVWRFETHGYYAATQLPGTIELIRAAAERGTFLAGTLRIDHRQRIAGGRTTRFPVAVIDLDLTVRQLAAGAVGPTLPAPSPEQQAIAAGVQPVVQDAPPPARAQIEAGSVAQAPRERRNAAAPIPNTGITPRPVADAWNPGRTSPARSPTRPSTRKRSP